TQNREQCVTNFQENDDIKLFLISLRAGGTGLNLTAADYVIHYDPWWNPAVELQATDRTHRIGQDKHVFVYKFISKDTVEEKVLELQRRKQALADNLISTDRAFFKQLTKDDIQGLFG
ncbi:MAG: helicase-related protein, partial [bacterium]